jgi:adenosine deaminase
LAKLGDRGFPHFIEIFVTILGCLRSAEDYELIAHEFGSEMARQNVPYADVTFSPSSHAWNGVPFETWFAGLTRGRERSEAELGVRMRWNFDIVRAPGDPTTTFPKADYTTGVAIDGMRDGVVALGLGGSEDGAPPEPFAPYFEKALGAGLRSCPHAGEHAGPESVWGALQALGAERIDHGVRAIEDPELVEYLAERGIACDVCPTSNLRLGVYPEYAAHPLRRLHEAGVPVTLNSDDPPMFNTTLGDEYALLAGPFGFGVELIDEVLLNGVRHSFLPATEKQALADEFRTELKRLKSEHLG